MDLPSRPPRIFAASASSRETSWLATHEQLWPVVARALRYGPLPIIGTHDWLELDEGDPRRIGSIYVAAGQFALHLENRGTAAAEASHGISAAAPWGAISRAAAEQRAWLEANPWAKREVVA